MWFFVWRRHRRHHQHAVFFPFLWKTAYHLEFICILLQSDRSASAFIESPPSSEWHSWCARVRKASQSSHTVNPMCQIGRTIELRMWWKLCEPIKGETAIRRWYIGAAHISIPIWNRFIWLLLVSLQVHQRVKINCQLLFIVSLFMSVSGCRSLFICLRPKIIFPYH